LYLYDITCEICRWKEFSKNVEFSKNPISLISRTRASEWWSPCNIKIINLRYDSMLVYSFIQRKLRHRIVKIVDARGACLTIYWNKSLKWEICRSVSIKMRFLDIHVMLQEKTYSMTVHPSLPDKYEKKKIPWILKYIIKCTYRFTLESFLCVCVACDFWY
jgi:hypothetical protein